MKKISNKVDEILKGGQKKKKIERIKVGLYARNGKKKC